jgi:hypothetical protein
MQQGGLPGPAAAPPPVEQPVEQGQVISPPARRPYDPSLARRLPSAGPGNPSAGPTLASNQEGPSPPQPPNAPAPPGAPSKPAAAPHSDNHGSGDAPVYKQWWFYVVLGVSALILIDIATAPSHNNNQPLGLVLHF